MVQHLAINGSSFTLKFRFRIGDITWPHCDILHSKKGFSPVGILPVTTALGSGAMMKSNSRRMSITMKRYSESIKSSARQAPPKVRRETKVCHGSAICLTFSGWSFHLWSESFLGDGHFLWPGEVVRPTGWVLDIDLVQHFLKFQQTKPWALEHSIFSSQQPWECRVKALVTLCPTQKSTGLCRDA